MSKFRAARFLFIVGISIAFFPFLIKRFLVLANDSYLYWICVDYISRCISLLGVILAAYCHSPLLTPPERADVGRSLESLVIMFVAAVFIEIVVVPPLFSFARLFDLWQFPTIENSMLRWFDLNFGLLLVAISEELVFRKIMLNMLNNIVKNMTFSVVTSSFVFGLVHWSSGLSAVIAAFLHGFVFAIGYVRSGRLLLCIATHYFIDRFGQFLHGGGLG
jgi:uncharacterized protein